MTYRKKFIALDLETTHLDLREGRIMEVGAAEFELYWDSPKIKVKFGKTFSSLVNPEIEPSETALAITGINKEELTAAPKWNEVKTLLKDFVADQTVIGHNVEFDLGYLKNQGLKLQNETIDTLELARTLLPLEISHSLESLAEGFDVLEAAPHRALVDCQHTAKVGAEVLNRFLSYPQKLQDKIKNVLNKSNVEFIHMLTDLPVSPSKMKQKAPQTQGDLLSVPKLKTDASDLHFPALVDKTVYCYPLAFNQHEQLLTRIAKNPSPTLIGLAHKVFLYSFAEQSFLNPALALCEKRFTTLSAQDKLAPAMAKILAKISILTSLRDSLDLSLLKWSPEEFEMLTYVVVDPKVCPEHACRFAKNLAAKKSQSGFAELATLFRLGRDWHWSPQNTALALFDLSAIEDRFTEAYINSWNLKKIRNLFHPLYPLEKNDSSMLGEMPREVETMLNELDLFFGILHLVYLKREGEYTENLVINESEKNRERFMKLVQPAKKLSVKIQNFTSYLAAQKKLSSHELGLEQEALSANLGEVKKFLEQFFLEPDEFFTLWLKFSSASVDLNLQAREIATEWKKFSANFASTTIIDTILPGASRDYFSKRLGLADYRFENCLTEQARSQIPIKISSKNLSPDQQISFFKTLPGKTLVLLPNELTLNKTFQILKKDADDTLNIFAYKFSGNVAVLKKKLAGFRGKNFLFLLTMHALIKHWQTFPELDSLVISKLPFEARGSSPALLDLPDASSFPNNILPRAISRLHRVITTFLRAGGQNKRIFVLDPRILTDYDQSFRIYLEEFPDFVISTD